MCKYRFFHSIFGRKQTSAKDNNNNNIYRYIILQYTGVYIESRSIRTRTHIYRYTHWPWWHGPFETGSLLISHTFDFSTRSVQMGYENRITYDKRVVTRVWSIFSFVFAAASLVSMIKFRLFSIFQYLPAPIQYGLIV